MPLRFDIFCSYLCSYITSLYFHCLPQLSTWMWMTIFYHRFSLTLQNWKGSNGIAKTQNCFAFQSGFAFTSGLEEASLEAMSVGGWEMFADNLNQTAWSESLSTHLNKEGVYCCPKCVYKTSKHHTFQRHMRTHDPSRKVICKICGVGYVENHLLKRHLQFMHGIPVGRFKCDTCGEFVDGAKHVCTKSPMMQ